MTPDAAVVASFPRPLERLEAELVELASQLTAAHARFSSLVGEFDAAEGWREWGMSSTAHWLSWQCGLGHGAAREQVRVARKLRGLPLIAAAFAAGRLSYSKVRAITRLATTETESTWVIWGEHATAAQIERIVAGQRRTVTARDTRERHAARGVVTRFDDDGTMVATIRLAPEQAVVFLQAIEAAKIVMPEPVAEVEQVDDDHPGSCEWCEQNPPERRHVCPHVEEHRSPSRKTARSTADAVVFIASRFLTDTIGSETIGLPGVDGEDRFQIVVHVSAETLRRGDTVDDTAIAGATIEGLGTTSQLRVHPSTARRLSCGCPTSTQTDDEHGNPLHLGRKTRRIRTRLATAVHRRDHGHCRAPGCTNRTTEIHHIHHWADGGRTCLDNLISLCNAHHWLVHDGGWHITKTARQAPHFHAPDGRTVPSNPNPVTATTPLPHNPTIHADAVTGHLDSPTFNLNDAIEWINQQAG